MPQIKRESPEFDVKNFLSLLFTKGEIKLERLSLKSLSNGV